MDKWRLPPANYRLRLPDMTMNKKLSAQDYLELDARNRERAIDTKASFIIEAPAGAGKTELLTQRFLALLTRVEDPEEIIALRLSQIAKEIIEQTSPKEVENVY